MALDQKFFKKSTAGSGTDQEQGLVLHLDANDVDSYDGDGSIWYDINGHEVNIPLIDKADNLQLHLNASDTTSYGGSGSTWTDISGNSRNGTITDPVFESGIEGGLDFNSASGTSGDKVEVAHNAAFNQQNNMTFEVWVKRDSTTEGNIFFKGANNSGGGNSYFFSFNPSWGYYFYSYAFAGGGVAGGGTYSGTSGLSTGVYEHVIITIDGSGNRKIYVNGTMSANNNVHNATGTGSLSDTGALTIGGYYPYAVHTGFNGRISVVRIYNTVLTAAEVGQNYRAGNFLNYSSIITSKHEATQDTLYTTNLNLSLDANGYGGSGNWQDGTNNNDGVIYGATYTNDGNSDYFDFDGSNDYMTVAGSDLNPANTKCIELWFNTDSTAEQYIISNNNGGAYGYHMGITSQKLFMWIYSQEQNAYHVNTSTGSSNTAAITTGKWNHAVWTMGPNASDNKIYLNGNLAYTHSSMGGGTYPSTAAHNGIRIGRYTSAGWFNGKLAQVRAYSTALTPAQINTNYNATKALYQNPTAFIDYRPDQYSGSGTSITNLGSLSNNAVLTGSPPPLYDEELGDYFLFDSNSSNKAIETASNVSGVNLNTDGFSWEYWVWVSTDYQGYIASLNYSTTYYNMSYRSNLNTIIMFTSGAYISSSTIELNKWHHIVATADSSGHKLYTNGVLTGSNTTAASNHNLNSKLYFGRYHSATAADARHKGNLGDMRFYKGVLTAEQVAQNYLATKNKYPNGINFTGSNISWNANGYFSFNGSNAKFGTSGAPSALINATGFTVSAWFWRTNGQTGAHTIVGQSHDNGNSGQNWILMMNSNTVYFHIYGTDNYAGVSDIISYETWTHLAGVVEADGVKRIYKNGIVQLSTSAGYSADTVSTYNTFVGNLGAINWHHGRIGAVKYYKKPLTADELLADFNATKGTYGL
tara:strand:+ start:294 stop:3065 length:2772 start_codon:yes stop_codon:yes gene_type:complete